LHDVGATNGNHAVYDESGGNTHTLSRFEVPDSTVVMAIRITVPNTTVSNNLFVSVPGGGVNISDTSGTRVYGNTFFNCGVVSPFACIWFQSSGATQTGNDVRNNIIYTPTGYSVGLLLDTNTSGWTSDYNLVFADSFGTWIDPDHANLTLAQWRSVSGQDAHSLEIDPLFTVPESDFTLSSASPARNGGKNLGYLYHFGVKPSSTWPSTVVTVDQNQNGAWDIGAYVFIEPRAGSPQWRPLNWAPPTWSPPSWR
jgi:parallel beta-helix repeat protein